MPGWWRSGTVAAAAVGGSALLRASFDPVLQDEAPMLSFLLGVAFAGLIGGLAAGLLATGVSLLVGTYLFIEPRGALAPLDGINVARLVLFSVEGTVLSLLSARVLRSRDALERAVARRTEALERSNRALETFAGTLSHDLRGPLRSMTGFAEILEQEHAETLGPEGRDYINRIADASRRSERLVSALLEYARIAREDVGSTQQASLESIVSQVRRELAESIEATGAEIEVRPPLGEVVGHPETLGVILRNLLSNALKFVPPGVAPRVSIWTSRTDHVLRLHVRDNGIGVPADQQRRIFRPFERINPRSEYAGTGLGLAIVSEAVRRMGGCAGVESNGTGSVFWVELPAAAGQATEGLSRSGDGS